MRTAAEQGFERIIVDTSGLGRFPVPTSLELGSRLAIRFSFDGLDDSSHDAIRGAGAFARALATLQRVAATPSKVEATFTVNARNYRQASAAVAYFAEYGVDEMNFHIVSLTGNAKATPSLALDPGHVLQVQEELEQVRLASSIPIRFPRLLVRKEKLLAAVAEGCECRLFDNTVLLLFPDGKQLRCPLEITKSLVHDEAIENPEEFSGCPLAAKLFPSGTPSGYVMTCISWKQHKQASVTACT